MKKNIWLGQKGLTLLELLLAFAIFAIFIPAFISFARTAISNNTSIQNQANATNQLKNAFNYVSADTQMSSTVVISPTSPANCVLSLAWINYPVDTIEVDYTLLNGVLTRIYTDDGDSTKNSTKVVATNINPDTAKTNFTWSGTSLTVNLTVTIGNANEVRQFQITPRVTQSSAQLANTLTLTTPSPSPASYGSTVTLTANFNPSTVNSGTVTFLDSSSPIPIGTAPVISGSATCTVSTLSVGAHVLSAVFSGDAEYKTSTSLTQSLTINKGATSTVVTAAPTSGTLGSQFVFSVASLPSDATGNVIFTSSVPGDSMNITVPVSGGAASTGSFTLSAAGVDTIYAAYSGDIDYNGSSGTVGVTVTNPRPVLAGISPASCYLGDSGITLTASGSSFVSSSVIYFGAAPLTTIFVNSGSLTATVPTTTAGSFSVTVQTPSGGGISVNSYQFVVIGAFDAAKSTLNPTSTTIIANGITTQVLTVQVRDTNNVNYTKGGLTGANAVTITKSSGNGTISAVTDNNNGTYTAIVTSTTLVGDSGVFVAAIGAGTVNSGGGIQTQATVNYGQGNLINISGSVNWGSITTGSGAGGQPSAADTINIQAGATLTVNSTGTNGPITNGQAYIINVNTAQVGTGTLTFQANTVGITVGTLNIAGGGSGASAQKGVVTAPSGGFLHVTNTINLSGSNWTFTQGSGTNATVLYDGSGNQTILSALVYVNLQTGGSGTKTFDAADSIPNLTIGGASTVMLGGALTVTGSLFIGTGTTLDVSSSNYGLTVKGNWTSTGTLNQRSGTVTLSGSVAQTMSGAITFYKLTLSNSNGLTINSNETVTNTLTLTNGDLTTGSNTLIAYTGTTNAAVSANANSYVIGNLRKYVTTGTNTIKFEVGTTASVDYTPASITFTGVTTAGTMTVNANSGKAPNNSTWPISSTQYINVYWQLTGSLIAGGTYAVDLTWINADRIGGAVYGSLNAAQYVISWSAKLTPTNRNANDTKLNGAVGYGYFVLGY